jgi:hypothetical protein
MYENLIDPQIQILERCQTAWDNMVNTPEDLTSHIPGLNKSNITKSFPMIIAKLKKIKAQSSEEASPFLLQTLSQNFPSWSGPLEGWIATSPANTANIYSHLNAMWSQLNTFDNEPNVPNVKDVQRIVGEIKRLEGEASVYIESIVGKDAEFEGKRDAVLNQCSEIVDKATDSLAAAARKGLAVSFEQRAAEYDKPRRGWLCTFVASLIIIFCISTYIIVCQLKDATGLDRLYYFLSDIPLTLPFIWLAWFSALRFSQLGRLKEDYKFKVAAALSLDGYRKQAEDLSPALQEKLLDLAITNFGENPLRLMTKDSAKDAHPLAGAINDKTLIEVIKALSDKVRK